MMNSGTNRIYVYYKVPESSLQLALSLSSRLAETVATPLGARLSPLSRRPEAKQGEVTVMECYELGASFSLEDVNSFIARLEECAKNQCEKLGLVISRHVEYFVPVRDA